MTTQAIINNYFGFSRTNINEPLADQFLKDNYNKKQLVNKISSLLGLISGGEIDLPGETKSIFTRVTVTHSFYRKHPFANYSDPGKKPYWAAGGWKKLVQETILPYQPYLQELSASLSFSSLFIEGKNNLIARDIEDFSKLYIKNTRLHLISMLAQRHINPSMFSVEQMLAIVFRLYESEISDEAILLAKSFLKSYFQDHSLEDPKTDSYVLHVIIKQLKDHLTENKYINSFSDFWTDYVSSDPKSIVLFSLFQRIIENINLLNKNNQSLGFDTEKKIFERFDFEDSSWDNLNNFFLKVLEPKYFSSPKDDWVYSQNICDIHIFTDLLQSLVCS